MVRLRIIQNGKLAAIAQLRLGGMQTERESTSRANRESCRRTGRGKPARWCTSGAVLACWKHSRSSAALARRGCLRIAESDLEAFLATCKCEGRQDAALSSSGISRSTQRPSAAVASRI